MRPHLVIFDCDGVLVDSELISARILAESLVLLGISVNEQEVDAKYRGKSLPDIIRKLETELGRPVPGDFVNQLNARTFAAFSSSLRAVAHVEELLTELATRGIDICVASSGSHEKIRHSLTLTGLAGFFEDRVFSAQDVERGKPAPDLFVHAAAQMGHSMPTCVVIEDSIPGVMGAVASEARVLGYVAPTLVERLAHAETLTSLGAQVFSDMHEVSSLLGLSE